MRRSTQQTEDSFDSIDFPPNEENGGTDIEEGIVVGP
jgi:hypothetical protein